MLKAGRVLIPDFQARVLFGVATFVGMLLLVFWVAVNEPGRMDVFTQQYHGRSIEAGASTFLNNCSVCHGIDGKGSPRAPALNNPMLFLKENPAIAAQKKVQDLKTQQANLTQQINDAKAKNQDTAALQKQLDDANNQVTAAQADLDKMMKDQGWDPNRDVRLNEVKWTGRLEDYLASTIISGRPTSSVTGLSRCQPGVNRRAGRSVLTKFRMLSTTS